MACYRRAWGMEDAYRQAGGVCLVLSHYSRPWHTRCAGAGAMHEHQGLRLGHLRALDWLAD